ncbi:MAG: nucleotidyltransferase [Bacteroidetes bacterium]|nr:nucleotidyltransferase [Bacteroidota bacterium]
MSMNNESVAFYSEALHLLHESGVPFMLGGAFAIFHYTGLYRDTKDLDIFLKPADYPRVLKFFADKGYTAVQHDVRWLAKVFKGDYFIDIIYNSVNNICTVDDSWFEYAQDGTFCDVNVKLLPPEELIWCKSYVWNRERFDGADINHVMLKQGKNLDWKRLLCRLDPHWHMLLAQLIMFQFVYPSEYRDIIPKWLFDELMSRANSQYDMPAPFLNVCRGPMIDNTQYCVDIKEWNYKSYTIMTT